MNRSKQNNVDSLLEMDTMIVYHREDNTARDLKTSSSECWRILRLRSPVQALPLVLVKATDSAWALGSNAVRRDVAALVDMHKSTMGYPTTLSHDVVTTRKHAAWVLCLPDGNYSFILVSPDVDSSSDHYISFCPVMAISPDVRQGSLEALELIFPSVASCAVELIQREASAPYEPPRAPRMPPEFPSL